MKVQILPNDGIQSLKEWVHQMAPQFTDFEPMVGDASVRRYVRVKSENQTAVVMDYPDNEKNTQIFLKIAQGFLKQGLCVPEIIAYDASRGFVLMSDLGNDLYFNVLSPQTVDALYQNAMEALLLIQACDQFDDYDLPPFGRDLFFAEMTLFVEWYLGRHLNYVPTAKEKSLLDRVFRSLAEDALKQTQLCVHRDYHCKNLLKLEGKKVGILDFQDAVKGPITYDLMSLLRDCYIDWSDQQLQQWIQYYYDQACEAKLIKNISLPQFIQWFDWMTLQRNLKCIGLFPRLNYRDQKPQYMQYLPRVFNYALRVCQRYPHFSEFGKFLKRVNM